MADEIVVLQLITGILLAFALMSLFDAASDRVKARWGRRVHKTWLSGFFVGFCVLSGGLYYWIGERYWEDVAVRYVVLMPAFFAFFCLLEMVEHKEK